MIKISNKSWHYKLYEFGTIHFYEQENLCRYCRCVMQGLLKIFMIIVLLGFIGFSSIYVEYKGFSQHTLLTFVVNICIIGLVLYVAFDPKIPSLPKSKILNLFSAWLSAKKQKICPLVEIVDESNTTDIV